MINGHDLGQLIELAFDYVSAETELKANQVHSQAAMLATETATFNMWLDLIDHIREWNSSDGHNDPMSWTSALQFLSTRQAKLNPSPTGDK